MADVPMGDEPLTDQPEAGRRRRRHTESADELEIVMDTLSNEVKKATDGMNKYARTVANDTWETSGVPSALIEMKAGLVVEMKGMVIELKGAVVHETAALVKVMLDNMELRTKVMLDDMELRMSKVSTARDRNHIARLCNAAKRSKSDTYETLYSLINFSVLNHEGMSAKINEPIVLLPKNYMEVFNLPVDICNFVLDCLDVDHALYMDHRAPQFKVKKAITGTEA